MRQQSSTLWPRERMLAAVVASPEAVARHDKQAWLALFTESATVEDPVGTPANTLADGGIERFYDTFIAPNEIRFRPNVDYCCHDAVMRDVVIETRMTTGANLAVPAHLLYRLTERDGRLLVAQLAAHWQLRAMVPRMLGQGVRGWRTMASLGARMLGNLGPAWVMGYSGGFLRGIFAKGVADVDALAGALAHGSETVGPEFHETCPGIEFPYGATPRSWSEFLKREAGRMNVTAIQTAGYHATFSFEHVRVGGDVTAGIGLLEYDADQRTIRRARFFV